MRIFMLKVLIRFNRWVAQRYVTEEVFFSSAERKAQPVPQPVLGMAKELFMIRLVRLIDDFSRLQPSSSEFHLLVRSEKWTQSSFEIDVPHRTELRIWCVYTTVGIDARDCCNRRTTFLPVCTGRSPT